jgi:uncharacterized protein (TIGR03067 family)
MQATILITALALSAPALKDPPKQELKIAGEWIVESQVTNGRPLKTTIERRYTFGEDGKWNLITKAKALNSNQPAAIDMKYSVSLTYTGIVKIEGDTLTLCYSRNDDERPTKFESSEGSTFILIVMKRAKKD